MPIVPIDTLRTKWSLFDVVDKSCSNTRLVKTVLVFSSSVVLSFSSFSDAVGTVMSSFDCSCHVIRVLVVWSVSKSGGLDHSRNRNSTNTKLVFVLCHIGSSRPPVNTACHVVEYGEKPRTERTYRLNIRIPSKIASLHWKYVCIHTCISFHV
jgi:hypothetical protein